MNQEKKDAWIELDGLAGIENTLGGYIQAAVEKVIDKIAASPNFTGVDEQEIAIRIQRALNQPNVRRRDIVAALRLARESR